MCLFALFLALFTQHVLVDVLIHAMKKSESFRTNYEDLRAYALDHLKQKVQCTWKVHILFCHIVQWLRAHPVGLGCYAEQTLEACHHSFNKTLKRHLVSESHPEHQARLRRSVVKYNSKRV